MSDPRFSALSESARVLWAKSGDSGGHCLLAHLLDVAAVVETILVREPESTRIWAAKAFGLSSEHVALWIAALAGLHDFGKGTAGFQAKWPEGMRRGLECGHSFSPAAMKADRHDLSSAALLGKALHALGVAPPRWIRHAVQAVSAHHGYHFLDEEVPRGRPTNESPTWGNARQETLQALWGVLSPSDRPVEDGLSLPAMNWLAGLTSAADWIASNTDWFVHGQRGADDLSAYYQQAKRLAHAALDEIGWGAFQPLLMEPMDGATVLARITGRDGIVPRPLQEVGENLLSTVHGPALLLVEAPMGEGKTELAFLAHLRLQAANGHRGLYVALPTQATGNALFRRALTFLSAFSRGPLDVQLIHGGASHQKDVTHLQGVAEDRRGNHSVAASAWFSQRRRPLLSPYGVGTVDQALLSVLNVKHHFVRLWGLSNRVVVLDEIHAYDTYTNGLIVSLLRWLKELDCSVVLMSATLPAARRAELLQAWRVGDPDEAPPAYPRILLADRNGARSMHFCARDMPPINLGSVDEDLEALADKAAELLLGGGCGAIIVNTVDRAQRLYGELAERLGADAMLLFHARFPEDERAEQEAKVLTSFGAGGERPERALLVATQVAEQSLDIDFDFMLTDLAPVDLLLQRAGRLHRHSRPRPTAHTRATLWVAGLHPERLPELTKTAWEYVYDAYILFRTWALLKDEARLELPTDIDRLVQAVYADDPLPELEERVRDRIEIDTFGEYVARVMKERREAQNIAIDPFEEPTYAYGNKPRGGEEGGETGLENKTRLGREPVVLIPMELVEPGWCVAPDAPLIRPDRPMGDAEARRCYSRRVKVANAAIVGHFQAQELPVAFDHPLLRHCRPLPLRDGVYSEGRVHLRLDPVLGLVVGKHGVRRE